MRKTIRTTRQFIRFRRNRKILIILYIYIIFIFVFAIRLFYLQINQNKKFYSLGEKNFLRTEMILSRRGDLLDCNGKLLATNRPVFNLYWKGSGRKIFSKKQKDALEKIGAGADLVQIYTGFIYEGPSLIKKINKAILKSL